MAPQNYRPLSGGLYDLDSILLAVSREAFMLRNTHVYTPCLLWRKVGQDGIDLLEKLMYYNPRRWA